MLRVIVAISLTCLLNAIGSAQISVPSLPGDVPALPVKKTCASAPFGRLPLYFIENQGQVDEQVAFYIKGSDKILFFTTDGITFALSGDEKAEGQHWALKLGFVGANPAVKPRGEELQAAVFSYFKGAQEDWNAGVPTYGRLVYPDLWPGIDLVYTGSVNQLKYEFVVSPGADPEQIRLVYEGTSDVAVTESGALRVRTPIASFEDAPPVAFQEVDGERVAVSMAYALDKETQDDTCTYGFQVGSYDPTRPLILDPAVLVYCGYIGGMREDRGYDIATDASGNVYVTGKTLSSETSFG